jgi:SPOR domain/CCDC81-like prokaryotic HU domain 2
MNNYLLHLLKEVKTIIIPGLGALTVTNEATGEIMFMPYLKYDDGTLAKHISEKEGMELNDAKNLIAKFVREVTIELDKGEQYTMYQFGSFSKVDGEIAFEQWGTNTAAEPAPNVTAEESQPEIPTPIVEELSPVVEEETATELVVAENTKIEESEIELAPTIPVPESVVENIPEEVPVTEAEVIASDETTATTIPESIIDEQKEEVIPVAEEKKATVATATKTNDATEKTATTSVTRSPKEVLKAKEANKSADAPPVKKKKTRVLSYIIWGVLVLLLGAGTFVALNFNSLKKDFPILADLAGEDTEPKDTLAKKLSTEDPSANPDSAAAPEPVPSEEIEQPVVVEETPAPVPTPKPVEKPAPLPKPTPTYHAPINVVTVKFPAPDTAKPYHIIAGSFSSETNAKRLGKQLKAKGMNQIAIGGQNGLYRVSIKGFATKEEAAAALPSVQSAAPGAWVYKWN